MSPSTALSTFPDLPGRPELVPRPHAVVVWAQPWETGLGRSLRNVVGAEGQQLGRPSVQSNFVDYNVLCNVRICYLFPSFVGFESFLLLFPISRFIVGTIPEQFSQCCCGHPQGHESRSRNSSGRKYIWYTNHFNPVLSGFELCFSGLIKRIELV